VAYVYSSNRRAEHPGAHLAGFRGVLQVDGYDGFKALRRDRDDGEVVLAFCWAHLRRRFFDIHAATQSPIAAEALLRIAALYAIEADIRGSAAEQRLAVRQAQSAPLVAELEAWLHAQLNRLSRGSKLAEAIRYGLRHWQGLSEFLSDGRLEMDTNTVEREIRPVAVTRKAALFAGSEGGGENWAIAAEALLRIAALYAIEAGIRGSTAEQRLAMRQAQSAPLVAELEAWLHAQLNRLSRGSKLAEAIRYGLRHWQGLSEFLSDGRLEMDTNTVEREIKPVAVTRKAALFAGSEGGGENWAIAATLIRTAILNGVDPQAWLTDVLEQMVSGKVNSRSLASLLPWAWRDAKRAELAA